MRDEDKYLFYIERGDYHFQQSKFDNAVSCYEKAAALDPKNIIPHLRMGDTNKIKGDLDASLLNYSKAKGLAHSPKSTISRKIGNIYFKKREYEKASAHYAEAIKLRPGYALNYQLLADAYFELGRLSEALSTYIRAIDLDNKNLRAYDRCSEIYFSQDDFDRGLALCNKAINLNPKEIKLYLNRATFYYIQENYVDAFRDCNKVLKYYPKKIEAYLLRGLLFLEEERYLDAIRDLDKVIEWEASAEAYSARAEANKMAGFLTNALCDLNSAHMLNPKNAEYQKEFEIFLKAYKKSQIYNFIKSLPKEKCLELLDQALRPETCLGRYFKIKKYVPDLRFFPSVKRMDKIKKLYTKCKPPHSALEVEGRKAYLCARIIAQGCRDEIGQAPSQFAFFRAMPLEIAAKIASMITDKLNINEAQKIILDNLGRSSVGRLKST